MLFREVHRHRVEATAAQDVAISVTVGTRESDLRRLELNYTSLGQAFYNQLPASAHSLAQLDLHGYPDSELQLIDFDFIAKLTRLSYFTFNRLLDR